ETFKDFPNKEDALRYALIRNMPEQRDSDFTWGDFTDFHDKELADNLGNFLNRVAVLTQKYYEGKVPAAAMADDPHGVALRMAVHELAREIEAFNFRNALQKLLEISSYGNTYLQDVSPWAI